MKRIKKTIIIIGLIWPILLTAQVPPPPNGGNNPDNNDPVGNGAPIGGGIAMLLAMGAAYGGKKYHDYRKKLHNEMEE